MWKYCIANEKVTFWEIRFYSAIFYHFWSLVDPASIRGQWRLKHKKHKMRQLFSEMKMSNWPCKLGEKRGFPRPHPKKFIWKVPFLLNRNAIEWTKCIKLWLLNLNVLHFYPSKPTLLPFLHPRTSKIMSRDH